MVGSIPFGRYQLDRRLAVGGMAEIFLGRIEGPGGFQKAVVIKRILPAFRNDERYVRTLINEARLGAKLNHPNLVQVHGFEEIDGQYCMVMEYVEGQDLRAVIDTSARLDRPLPLPIAAAFVAEAAAGLHYAHVLADDDGRPLGVVHRDVSPENILVTLRGVVKVLDFGIAKHDMAVRRTTGGVVMGKFPYMSPEQAAGQPLDARSDLFSLGAVFYELLTLVSCFRRPTPFETLKVLQQGDFVPARVHRLDLPAELEAILTGMLAVERDQRWADAALVAQKLESFLGYATRPTPEQVHAFLTELFEKTSVSQVRGFRLLSSDEVLVGDELAEPGREIDPDTHRVLLSQRELQAVDVDGPTVSLAPGTPVVPRTAPATPVGGEVGARLAVWWRDRPPLVRGALGFGLAAFVLVAVALALPSRRPLAETAVTPIALGPTRPAAVVAGELRLTTEPAGAVVTVDGQRQERPTPLVVAGIDRGRGHQVTIERPDFVPVTRQLLFAEGDSPVASWFVALTPTPASPPPAVAPPPTPVADSPAKTPSRVKPAPARPQPHPAVVRKGKVVFDVRPWADIYLAGKKLGTTPIAPLSLAEGDYDLKLVNPKLGVERTVHVSIQAGQTAKVIEQLGP